jgi:ABC-type sugar transport system substrate-binding protein
MGRKQDLTFVLALVPATLVAAAALAEDQPIVGYAGSKLTDPFMIALTHATQKEAKAQSVDLLAPTNANGDAAKQVTDVRTLLAKSPKA